LSSLEIAFYIDKKGKRVKNDWSISWDGNPTAFAFRFPYVVAFNSNFIEIRHMDTVSFPFSFFYFFYRSLCANQDLKLG
jgi:hypothetical protein